MLKNILLRILKPNHQPEMIVGRASGSDVFTQPEGEELAVYLIDKFWTGNAAASSHHKASMIKKVADKLMEDCRAILASPDPRMANRQLLAESVLRCAQLQVLVIAPAPEPDGSGLRGHLGMTGELKAKILDIIRIDKEFDSFPEKLDFDKAWNQIQYAYRRSWACMNVFEGLRHEFNDFHPEMSEDWFRPFFASQCAYAEHHYRAELGMPLGDKNDAGEFPGASYGDYRSIVLNGDQYPDQIWEKNYPTLVNPKIIWSS